MTFPFLLAHGGLGEFDEIIFLGIAAIFIALMGISWVRSRNIDPDLDEKPKRADETDRQTDSPEHIALD